MSKKRVAFIGGGVAGTLAANLLARKLRSSEAEIVVIDPTGEHVYQPGFLYVPFDWERPETLVRPEKGLLSSRIRLVKQTVVGIDTARTELSLSNGEKLGYDYLVIATGSIPDPSLVPGLEEGGDHFYTMEGSLVLRDKLSKFEGGRVIVGVGGLPYKCPVAPLEFVFLLEWYLRRKGLRAATELEHVSPLPRSFPIQSVSDLATPLLAEKRIENTVFFNVEEVDSGKRVVYSLEGEERGYDLLVLIPPHRGAQVLIDSGLGEGPGGWVPTDRKTLKVQGYDNIYAIGDATNLPISKSGSAAHFEAEPLVANIAAELRGGTPDHEYDGHVMCFLEVGDNRASLLDFNYRNPPQPPDPSMLIHYGKIAFNKAYWWMMPQGRLPNISLGTRGNAAD